jgi:hypothetical protein
MMDKKLQELKKCLEGAKQIAEGWRVDEEGIAHRVSPEIILKAINAGLWWCDHNLEDAEKLWKAEGDR